MRQLQYMLQVLSSVIPAIPPVEVDGIFGPATRASVLAAQRYFGLPQSGAVDETDLAETGEPVPQHR